jgi:hypothetical protein
MEIDVFYQNDDMSFGFDGMSKLDKDAFAFAKKAQYGFEDVDYSYADGTPDNKWGSREKDAYKSIFLGWKRSYKFDCVMIQKYIDKCKKKIKQDEDEQITGDADKKRVLGDYIKGSKYALSELEGYFERAECSVANAQQEEEILKRRLQEAQTNSKLGTYLAIGSVVLLVGIVGFLAYRRFKQ